MIQIEVDVFGLDSSRFGCHLFSGSLGLLRDSLGFHSASVEILRSCYLDSSLTLTTTTTTNLLLKSDFSSFDWPQGFLVRCFGDSLFKSLQVAIFQAPPPAPYPPSLPPPSLWVILRILPRNAVEDDLDKLV